MIKVLLFAHLQEEAGRAQLEIAKGELTVGDLKKLLTDQYHLSKMENVMAAVNEKFAVSEDLVKSGDTVAMIPPVSGG
ncbi:molybdopterin converting factor subunit 1 [Bacillus sp. P14.5]|uniref:molybdopterin converting factor subunit 1 n=1 Tax=Bacillus sp. P14.5 TaxID=1983400 RepID=UPI000DE94DB0|nr:molybdopterin converting factor subunit 1 [Bacillus sp. P14.5]